MTNDNLPPVPQSKEELLIEALRIANRSGMLLVEIEATLSAVGRGEKSLDDVYDLLARRFSDCSAVQLFVAARNLQVDLPADIAGQSAQEED